MNPEQNGHESPADSPELQQFAYAINDLDAAEQPSVEEHLANNPPARAAVSQTGRLATALREAYDQASLPAASSALRTAVAQSLQEKRSPAPRRTPSSTRKELAMVLAIAGCFVSTVMLVLANSRESGVSLSGGAIVNLDQSHESEFDGIKTKIKEANTPGGLDGLTQLRRNKGMTILHDDSASMASNDPPRRTDPQPFPVNAILSTQYVIGREALAGRGVSAGVGKMSAAPDDGPAVVIGLDPSPKPRADFDIDDDDLPAFGALDAEPGGDIRKLPPDDTGLESGDKFTRIYENDFKAVGDNPLSTFSIDVDTASYSKTRQYLMEYGRLPPPDAVRIEELVNYFPYDYLAPMGDKKPFTSHMEVSDCPWKPEHRLARIAIKGKEIKADKRPVSNLVFLIDVSGSMNEPNRLPLVIKGMKMLVAELGAHDRVAMVVYAGAAGLVLPSTPGNEQERIVAALDKLHAGGSTAGGAGLKLAYETARDNFIEGGVNRVLLCTDGDFNVGVSSNSETVRMAEEEAKNRVFLSILGFGIGNLNDAMLEQVANKANGLYAFIDTENEARKVLVEQLSGTLVTIAKDVKIQIEFNPKKVAAYRLIGYENRLLAAEDFNDDTKDAGEIGAGHNVTALYEIIPADVKTDVKTPEVDELKYQTGPALTKEADSDELLTLKLRYKQPDGDTSWLQSFPVEDNTQRFSEASDDFQFAAAVASFGMLLRNSAHKGNATFDAVHEIAGAAIGKDEWGYRKEFLDLVAKAKELTK